MLASKDKIKFIVLLLFFGFVIFLSYYFELYKKFSVEQIKDFIQSAGIFGPVIYMISYAFTSIILFPSSLLSTTSGMIWGAYLGTFYTVVGATISASIPFFISRFLGRSFAEKMMKGSKLNICDKFISRNGFFSVLIMRLIPIFPWDLVNYGSGLCGIRLRDYIAATFLGIIPGSFVYNLIGSMLGQPIDKFKIALVFIIVIVMSLTLFFYKKVFMKKKVNTSDADTEKNKI